MVWGGRWRSLKGDSVDLFDLETVESWAFSSPALVPNG